ncbi:MAG TPA: hypothetical protein VFN13_08140 [Rudaea sp.]|nr:hypothetical protein [Rudaea sp.]
MSVQPLPGIRRALIVRIVEELNAAQVAITELLGRATRADATRRLNAQRTEIARLLDIFKVEATREALASADAAWKGGIEAIAKQTGVSLTPRIDPRSLLAIRTFMTHKIADVSQQAVSRINTTLTQHLLGVRSMSEAISDIQAHLGGSTRRRAMTIAYTEIGRAYSVAQYEKMLADAKRIPGLKKKWLHSGRSHPRPGHVLAASQDPILVAQPFPIVDLRTGETEHLRFPRDPDASAFNTINCGCMMIAVPPKPGELFARPADASAAAATPAGGDVPPVPPVPPIGGGGGGAGPPENPHDIMRRLIANLSIAINAAQGLDEQALVRALWLSVDSWAQHVQRRINRGEIASAAALAKATLEALANADLVQVAASTVRVPSAQLQAKIDGWIVIVNADGRIVTSYPFKPGFRDFATWNLQEQLTPVYDYALTPTDREVLARLRARP